MKASGSVYVAAVFAVLAGYFTYQGWFNPSRAVKRRLGEVAAALSSAPHESDASRLARLAQLRRYLAADIRVRSGDPPQEIASRDAVLAIASGLRSAADGLEVRLIDTDIFIDGATAAHAYTTVDLITPDPRSGQPTIDSHTASVGLARIDGDWLITTAELKATPTRP